MKDHGIIFVLCMLLIVCTPVLASEQATDEHVDEEGGIFTGYIGESIWTLVWFGVLLITLWRFAWKPLLGGLQNRQDHIAKEIADAEKTKTAAQQTLEEYQAQLADAERQGKDIIASHVQKAEQEAREVKAQNQQEVQRMKVRMEADLKRERVSAEDQLWQQAGEIVQRLGKEVFNKSLDDADNQKLIDEAIARLKESHREGQ